MKIEVRGRFAPSPTGILHWGSLYTALASFLQARSVGGKWYLRIDDVDPHRTVPGVDACIQRDLATLGLDWDGPVCYQSTRTECYRVALSLLKEKGLLYSCACSRKELGPVLVSMYPGYCRNRKLPFSSHHAVRMLTCDTSVSFLDRIQGAVAQNISKEVGDFIVFRRDHVISYHLATVCDDAEQGITEVMRGTDLLDSTPRQIYLQHCLALPHPAYAHIPVLVDSSGQKLSKHTFAPAPCLDRPGHVLFDILHFLNQSPPPPLKHAPVHNILEWAISHWDDTRLVGTKTIPLYSLAS